MASKTVTRSIEFVRLLGTGHYLYGGGGVGEIMGWAKREFHDDWGWVIVCFVKSHNHYNSCERSK